MKRKPQSPNTAYQSMLLLFPRFLEACVKFRDMNSAMSFHFASCLHLRHLSSFIFATLHGGKPSIHEGVVKDVEVARFLR